MLTLENKYGDVYLPDLDGDLILNVSYGDLRTGKIKYGKDIELKYVNKAIMEKVAEGEFNLRYSEVMLDKADDVKISSRSSEISIEYVKKLSIESAHDELDIEEAGEIEGELDFSQLRVDLLEGSLRLKSKYGDVVLKQIMPTCTLVSLRGDYTDYNLAYDRNSGVEYSLSLEYAKSDVVMPTEGVEVASDSGTETGRRMSGKFGPAGNGKLQIDARSSDIYISRN